MATDSYLITDVADNAAVPLLTRTKRYEAVAMAKEISIKINNHHSRIRALQRNCKHPEGYAVVGKSGQSTIGECPYCLKEKLF